MMLPSLMHERPYAGARQTVPMDFRANEIGRRVRTDPDGVTPCVVLLTKAADRESDELSMRLTAERIPVLRLDSDRVAGVDLAYDPDQHVLRVGGDRYRPRVAWLRSSTADTVATTDDVQRDSRRLAALMEALLADQRVHVINGAATVESPDRANQLVAAAAVGLRVPITVVTTRPADAVDRIPGTADLMIKSLDVEVLDAAPQPFARRVSRAEVLAEQAEEAAPVIVQEFVEATRELRIVLIGGTFYAYGISANVAIARTVMPPAAGRAGRIGGAVGPRRRRVRPARHVGRAGLPRGERGVRLDVARAARTHHAGQRCRRGDDDRCVPRPVMVSSVQVVR